MVVDYDLVVIGAGPGGLAASQRAAKYGATVAIAELAQVGGTCVNYGCIPEKFLHYAANFAHLYRDALTYGWSHGEPTFNWQRFMTAKEREIQRLDQLHLEHLQDAGIDLLSDRAALIDAHTLSVGKRSVTADKILVAVGSTPTRPDIPGVEHTITPRQLFYQPQQPERIAILGGSYMGVKSAGMLQQLGCQVTQVFPELQILSDFDHDIGSIIQAKMSKQGVTFYGQTRVVAISPVLDGFEVALSGLADPLTVDAVLTATGIKPNTASLALENAGVRVTEQGMIMVDRDYRTTQPNIFAVGDCTRLTNCWTPVAIAEGRAFAEQQFGSQSQPVNYEFIPATVSSEPEAATVGWSEAHAREKLGGAIRCYQSQFRPLIHCLAQQDERTFVKLVVEEASDRVLGVHMVGQYANEIVQSLAIALRLGVTKQELDRAIGIHPSSAEEFFSLH